MAHVEGGRTIVVSNRGPVTFTRGESGEREYSRGAGGLVTALNAVLRRVENAVWIASAVRHGHPLVPRCYTPSSLANRRRSSRRRRGVR